ncbi:alpha/beta hydrolase [Roseovarius sp. 2305UL8-3]|uniref:alpha/beta hydrolase n=1 Tax=Roseovarius conchicola TaxID=3121636 RepID=UPI003527E704
MQKFSDLPSWANFRRVLSDEFGISLESDPVEHAVPIRGHLVRMDEWPARGECEGTVILVHGGGGNGRILAPLAEPIAGLGWRVLAPDLPGFGLTEPSVSFDWDYAEWPAVIAEIANAQQSPVVLMGLSMGGMTAFFAAQKCDRVAGVMATTLLDLSDEDHFVRAARWPWLGNLSLLSMSLTPWLFDRVWLPLSLATPLREMSSSKPMQRYFSRDPLIGKSWKPARFFRTVHAFKPSSIRLDCPLLLVHPGADFWTPTELSLEVFERIDAPKEFIELSNGSHLPLEKPAYKELAEQIGHFLMAIAQETATVQPTLQSE